MRKFILLTISILSIALFSCRKDTIDIDKDDPYFPPPDVNIVSAYSGIVKDEAGVPIEGAVVTSESGQIELTDKNGYFLFNNQSLSQGGSLFKVGKDGFYEGIKFIFPTPGVKAFAEVALVREKLVGSIFSAEGGELIIDEQGALIKISAGTIVDASGASYEGQIQVYSHWYDPSDPDVFVEMPGDLRGVNASNEEVQLETYGMLAVELRDDAGQELFIANGETVELNFPIVDEQLSNAPDTIPLWSMNEGSGIWEQEGVAVKLNDIYLARVSHFSFWNCDAPFPLVTIEGTIKDIRSNIIPNVLVCILRPNGFGTGYGYTNEAGVFTGKVPKEEELLLQIKNDCGDVIYVETINPLSEDTDLGMIIVDNPSIFTTFFQGEFLQCGSTDPVENGYVVVTDDEGLVTIANLSDDGSFSGNIISCVERTLYFEGIDEDGITSSNVASYELVPGEDFDVPALESCNALDEFVQINYDAVTDLYTNINEHQVNIVNDELEFVFIKGNGLVRAKFSIEATDPEPIKLFEYSDEVCTVCDLELTITELPSGVSTYCAGKLIGNINIDGNLTAVDIEFRVQVEKELFIVSGIFWEDLNENNLRDMGEPGIALVDLFASHPSSPEFPIPARTNSEGEYSISVPKGLTIDLVIQIQTHQTVVTQDAGDDSIDSDFNAFAQISDVLMDGPKVFDCGMLIADIPLTCQIWDDVLCDNLDCIDIIVEGGQSPYSISVNGEVQGGNQNAYTFCGLDFGVEYLITVTDNNGDECQTQGTLDEPLTAMFIPTFSCLPEISTTMATIVDGGNPPYTYNWSNGSTSSTIGGLLSPGTYTCTVVDNEGCEVVAFFEVPAVFHQIKGTVWDDNLGILDNEYESEDGIEGVVISIMNVTLGTSVETTTDENGNYSFEDVIFMPGDYVITVLEWPIAYTDLVLKDAVSDIRDSDADPITKETDVFTLTECSLFDFDFGLK